MYIGVTNSDNYTNIANAIRQKTGSSTQMLPKDMAQNILNIKTLTIDSKTFTVTDSNNTFSINFNFSDINGYENLTVNNFAIKKLGVNPKTTINVSNITLSYTSSTGIVQLTTSTNSISFYGTVIITCYH